MSKGLIYVLLVCALGVLGYCWSILPSNNLRFSYAVLTKTNEGEAVPFSAIYGEKARRVCFVLPNYKYASLEDREAYFGQLLTVPIEKVPLSLSDGEGGRPYLFIVGEASQVEMIELRAGWDMEDERTYNWCAASSEISIAKRDGMRALLVDNFEEFPL